MDASWMYMQTLKSGNLSFYVWCVTVEAPFLPSFDCTALRGSCSVLQYVAFGQRGGAFLAIIRVLQCVAVYCSVLQCVAVCCIVIQRVEVCCGQSADREPRGSCVIKCVSIWCCVFQCVAVCCSGSSHVWRMARLFLARYSFWCGVTFFVRYVFFVCVCGYDEYGTTWLVSLQKSSVRNVLLCAAVSPRLVASFEKETSPHQTRAYNSTLQYTVTHCNTL